MIKIRDFQESDMDRLVELANNRNVSMYLIDTFPFPYTMDDAMWWIETGVHKNPGMDQALEYQGELVGGIGLTPGMGWKSHSAEIGYWIGETYWGKGLATAGLKEMTHRAFGEHRFTRIFASVLDPNAASMRVLEKCGFEKVGQERGFANARGEEIDELVLKLDS